MSFDQAPPASDLLVQTTSSQTTVSQTSAGVTSAPPGGIMDYGGLTAPSGWLLCDGSAVSRTTYSALFAAIGVLYGTGDGSTTFNIPDCQGRATVGLAGASGHTDVKTVGNNDGTALASRRPKHKHTVVQPTINISDPSHAHTESGFTTPATQAATAGGGSDGFGSRASSSAATGITATATAGTVGPQTGAEPTDTIPYIVFPKIIKT